MFPQYASFEAFVYVTYDLGRFSRLHTYRAYDMQPFPRKRTTTGCLTCRMRRKKCDEEKPTCTGCQRNFLICTWPPGSKAGDAVSLTRHAGQKLFTVSNGSVDHVPIRSTASKSTASQPIIAFNAAASTLPHPLAFMPGPRRESDGLLFDHYLQITSMQIAGRVKPRNPFLSHLIPIAYTDAAVFQSLLALSGAQLCAKSSAYEHNARSHYAVTLRSVKHTLLDWRKADARALTGLLTATIMLCFYEVRKPQPFPNSLLFHVPVIFCSCIAGVTSVILSFFIREATPAHTQALCIRMADPVFHVLIWYTGHDWRHPWQLPFPPTRKPYHSSRTARKPRRRNRPHND